MYSLIKKKNVLVLLLCYVICNLNAEDNLPLWYTDRELAFPDSQYISAIGSSKSVSTAKSEALSQLSLFFSAKIKSNTNSSYQSSLNNKQSTSSIDVAESVSVFSDSDIAQIVLTKPYKEQSTGLWHVCAYIDRRAYSNYLLQDINNLFSSLSSSYSLLMDSDSLFIGFTNASKIIDDSKVINSKSALYQIVSNKPTGFEQRIRTYRTEAERFLQVNAKRITFSVEVLESEIENSFKNRIENALKIRLENLGGIIASNSKSRFKATIKISMESFNNNVGVFVIPSVNIEITDLKDNLVCQSWTKQLSKIGHNSEESAKQLAYSKIEKYLLEDFFLTY